MLLARRFAVISVVTGTLLVGIAGLASRPAWAQKSGAADAVSVPQLMKNLDSDAVHVAASAAKSLGFIFGPAARGATSCPR